MTESNEKKKILVVEDEPFISSLCVRVLTNEGLEVSIAVNGYVAENLLDENHYDLCLIDIRTPIVDGKELYKYIAQKYPELISRIIFTTGDVIGGDTQNFLKETGCSSLLKPFAPEELRTKVKEVLQSLAQA